ncbi:hypothetical protein BDD12DRAFT_867772 [Trichophaea hybrida]|nr:hypothetical protein BDD12DRAFT_867772 [Trichophaea hybrida]
MCRCRAHWSTISTLVFSITISSGGGGGTCKTYFASVMSNNASRSKRTRCFDIWERCHRLLSCSALTTMPRFSSSSSSSISLSSSIVLAPVSALMGAVGGRCQGKQTGGP